MPSDVAPSSKRSQLSVSRRAGRESSLCARRESPSRLFAVEWAFLLAWCPARAMAFCPAEFRAGAPRSACSGETVSRFGHLSGRGLGRAVASVGPRVR
ncbi:unnamed protein product, partial [Iphiclides podalirius]